MGIYDSKHYKLLLLIPITILVFALYFSTKVEPGIDLQGGTLVTVSAGSEVNADQLKQELEKNFELEDLKVRSISGGTTGVYIEFKGEKNLLEMQKLINSGKYHELSSYCGYDVNSKDAADKCFSQKREEFKNAFVKLVSRETGASSDAFSIQEVGPSLGKVFLDQARNAIIIAFVLIIFLIFYYFRTPVVSFAVAQSAFFDVLVAYSSLGFLGIPLSLSTIAPLLMLIGYSVDTDIMLTDWLISRKTKSPTDRAYKAMKTGLTMTGTTLTALTVMLLVAYYAHIITIMNIALVLLFGLLADLVGTWFTNAVIILWHLEKKVKK